MTRCVPCNKEFNTSVYIFILFNDNIFIYALTVSPDLYERKKSIVVEELCLHAKTAKFFLQVFELLLGLLSSKHAFVESGDLHK